MIKMHNDSLTTIDKSCFYLCHPFINKLKTMLIHETGECIMYYMDSHYIHLLYVCFMFMTLC